MHINHVGVPIEVACEALSNFKGMKCRLEVKHQTESITLYDDFAYHPNAIKTTIEGLHVKVTNEPIIAILELRSNTMQSGVHQQTLVDSLENTNQALILRLKHCDWNIKVLFKNNHPAYLFDSVDDIVNHLSYINHGYFVVMYNGVFYDIFNKIIPKL